MNEEIKKILMKSVKELKLKGGMTNKDVKPVIVNLEKLIRTRRNVKGIKKA